MPDRDPTHVPAPRTVVGRGSDTKTFQRQAVQQANSRTDDLVDVVVGQAQTSASNAWKVSRWLGTLLAVSMVGNILLVALVLNRNAAFEFMGIKASSGASHETPDGQ